MVYSTYDDYTKHQSSKLVKEYNRVVEIDRNIESKIYKRYIDLDDIKVEGKSILCLAARLGGEVRAFKKLGAREG